jgi:tRNA 2-selenouridine synthase
VKLDPDLPEIDDLKSLFLSDIPLMDVRAPVEFAEGAFPQSRNLPLIDDQERHQVGKTYKDLGQDAAVELGLELVSGDAKAERIRRWQAFAEKHPNGVLYCFRGGMRSKISQQWLHEHTGITYPRVRGGYKALRRFLIEQLEKNSPKIHPVVIGGRTGVGKTRLLQQLTPHLDLEGLAWHRGSAFGRHATPQPPQIGFENALSIAVLKLLHNGNPYFATEDESRNIGARHMPMSFFEPLSHAPVVVLEASREERIEVTLQEYVYDALEEYQDLLGESAGFDAWAENLENSLFRIRKRLGGENHQMILGHLLDAIARHRKNGETENHRIWIEALLVDYYDSMYSYQLEKKRDRIVFTGNREEVFSFLQQKYDINKFKAT